MRRDDDTNDDDDDATSNAVPETKRALLTTTTTTTTTTTRVGDKVVDFFFVDVAACVGQSSQRDAAGARVGGHERAREQDDSAPNVDAGEERLARRAEKGKLGKSDRENRYRHATMALPFACVQTMKNEKEEERGEREREEKTLNCLKIFKRGRCSAAAERKL